MKRTWRLIYIAGRGHSGTTLLDVLLGSAPGTESVGEILSGLNRGTAEDCSCGKPLSACPYWQRTMQRYRNAFGSDMATDGAWLFAASDVRRFAHAWFADFSADQLWRTYAKLNGQLFDALLATTDGDTFVDSNKEFTRALVLLKSAASAKVIHLVRDPVPLVGSYYYRQEQGMPLKFLKREYHLRSGRFPALMLIAASWSVGVLLGILLKARFPDRVLHVSYDRLCAHPRAELERIADFAHIDLLSVIEGVEHQREFSVGHNIGGNEMRHARTVTFSPQAARRRALPLHYQVGTQLLTAPGKLLALLFMRS